MICLGLDPSLTQFGWALHNDEAPTPKERCVKRGRFKTTSKQLFVDRYTELRESLYALIDEHKPDVMGIEYPVFNNIYSEGMYGLFLYSCEAIRKAKQDIVFFSPGQIKATARDALNRPKGWKMMKGDMVQAAQADAGGGRWNHNEADAYWCAVHAARFWRFFGQDITESELTKVEQKQFANIHTYVRGSKAGTTVKTGISYREDERFFRWSKY